MAKLDISKNVNEEETFLSPEQQVEDLARQLYENPANGFLLARTFRSGASNGVETELAYLENAPGFIFANPTTVISKNFASKTISQTPGNDWSGQPSLLFSIEPQKGTTIANYGIASLNSFSSTEAIALMNKFSALEQKQNSALTMSEKMSNLQQFLKENWTSSVNNLKKQIAVLEKKSFTATEDKTFYKPFDLFFHSKDDYNRLMFSLDKLYKTLEKAHNLSNLSMDIELRPHPLAAMIMQRNNPNIDEHVTRTTLRKEIEHELENSPHESTIERTNKLKGLLIRAIGEHKRLSSENDNTGSMTKEEMVARRQSLKQEALIYDQYANYLDVGARHNELVSRVYPWEITGLEWGADIKTKVSAVSCLMVVTQKRQDLFEEFNIQGVKHPLFVDFMTNKLSIEHPELTYLDIQGQLMQHQQHGTARHGTGNLNVILDDIKSQLQRPIYIYEYSASKRELTNISSLVEAYRDHKQMNDEKEAGPLTKHNAVKHYKERLTSTKKSEECAQLFEQGMQNYYETHPNARDSVLPSQGLAQ